MSSPAYNIHIFQYLTVLLSHTKILSKICFRNSDIRFAMQSQGLTVSATSENYQVSERKIGLLYIGVMCVGMNPTFLHATTNLSSYLEKGADSVALSPRSWRSRTAPNIRLYIY